MTTPHLVTAKELAPMIGLTGKRGNARVTEWKQAGKIPAAVDEPGFVRYDPDEVIAALKKRAVKRAKTRNRTT